MHSLDAVIIEDAAGNESDQEIEDRYADDHDNAYDGFLDIGMLGKPVFDLSH